MLVRFTVRLSMRSIMFYLFYVYDRKYLEVCNMSPDNVKRSRRCRFLMYAHLLHETCTTEVGTTGPFKMPGATFIITSTSGVDFTSHLSGPNGGCRRVFSSKHRRPSSNNSETAWLIQRSSRP